MKKPLSFDPLNRDLYTVMSARSCGKSHLMKEAMDRYIKANPGAVVVLATSKGTKRLR